MKRLFEKITGVGENVPSKHLIVSIEEFIFVRNIKDEIHLLPYTQKRVALTCFDLLTYPNTYRHVLADYRCQFFN